MIVLVGIKLAEPSFNVGLRRVVVAVSAKRITWQKEEEEARF